MLLGIQYNPILLSLNLALLYAEVREGIGGMNPKILQTRVDSFLFFLIRHHIIQRCIRLTGDDEIKCDFSEKGKEVLMLKNGDATFSRVELVLGVVEDEEFTIRGDASATIWKLKRDKPSGHSGLSEKERWSIIGNSCDISPQELLRLINQPEMIQSLREEQRNHVFCTVNNTIKVIASQIIISLLLIIPSVISLLLNLVSGVKMELSDGLTFIHMLLGIALFGYYCYKLGAYISENKEILI